MLGRLLAEKKGLSIGYSNGLTNGTITSEIGENWRASFETIDWINPNAQNLVADGKLALQCHRL